MIRCSCQGDHGCVPVAPSAMPSGSTSACSCSRRSAIAAGTSAKRLATAGLDLDLGRDQLADEVRLERRPLRGRLHLLEAVDEAERRRVEQRELLLDRDGEVGAARRRPPAPRGGARRTEPLLVTHAAEGSRRVRGGGVRRPPSSSGRPSAGGRRRAAPRDPAPGSASSSRSFARELARVAGREGGEPAQVRRVLLLEPLARSRRGRSAVRRAAATRPRPPRRRPCRRPRGRSTGRP